jgi:type I restriction enzyme, S subunit
MRDGFKMTELGEIPENWELEKIDNLLSSGRIISHLDGNHGELYPKASDFVDQGIPYVGANSFVNGKVDFSLCKRLSKERALMFKKGVAKKGDVLFAHNATVGPVAFLETNLDFVILSTTATYYRLDNKTINAKYWLYFLSSQSFSNQYSKVMGQSTRNQVPITMQRSFLSILPPFSEQTKIAEILSAVDEKIEVIQEQINQTTELKKGLLQQLLTKGIGHTQFKASSLGEISENWEIVRLSDVASFSNGKGHEQFIDERGEFIVVNSKFISSDGEVKKFSNRNLCPLYEGDITMVMSDIPNGKAIAKCFIVDADNKYTLNQRICSLSVKPEVDVRFLYYVINRNSYYLAIDNGVSQTNLRKEEVTNCPIQLPPFAEQKKISAILTTLDEKIQILTDKRNYFCDLKKGLMQQLLTGKLRVNQLTENEVFV